MRVAFVSGIVTPYTHRLFERLGARLEAEYGGGLSVFACSEREPGRHWHVPAATRYERRLLGGLRLHRSYVSHVYLNPGIVPAIARGGFDVVLVNDFPPTMMLAAATARMLGLPVVISTDGQPETDPGARSAIHRFARRLLVPASAAGVGASRGSLAVLERYGLPPEAGVISPLAPGWDFTGDPPPFEARVFDLLFCGHLDDDRKGALFFADVVDAIVARGRRPSVRVTGDGPLRGALAERLAAAGVVAHFDGYLEQADLGAAYASARVFLFPSRGDPWGLVANEAIQCGTPLIASPHAQAARELVGPSGAGRVLPLSVEAWADAAETYLDDRAAWTEAQGRAAVAARGFTLDAMAQGFIDGFTLALERDNPGRGRLAMTGPRAATSPISECRE